MRRVRLIKLTGALFAGVSALSTGVLVRIVGAAAANEQPATRYSMAGQHKVISMPPMHACITLSRPVREAKRPFLQRVYASMAANYKIPPGDALWIAIECNRGNRKTTFADIRNLPSSDVYCACGVRILQWQVVDVIDLQEAI